VGAGVKAEITLVSRDQLDNILLTLREAVEEGDHEVIIRKATKQRTLTQNGALHRYCELMAIKMNDAGVTQRELVGSFKNGFELPVSKHMIKSIFREVGKAMYEKQSTSDLETKEISEVHRVVDQRFSEVTGVGCEWPSRFGQ